MKIAPRPINDAQRLDILRKYEILDSEAEKEFDDLTQLASFICNTPISIVTLIDEDRQWFKSKVGFDATEAPRDTSFCGHVILEDEVMVINDATKDDRFHDNPAVTGEFHLRFYAGAPLIDKSGFKLGSLCVVDRQPRELSKEQIDALKKLSRLVVAQMELRLELKKQIERENIVKINSMQMLHSAKMSTLGEMAGGISHEINNPLAIIQGKLFHVKKMLESFEENKEKIFEGIDRIEQTTARISKIINGLLHFSRDAEFLQNERVQVQEVVQETLLFCEERLKQKGIELYQDLGVGLYATCQPIHLSQALLNLLNNSFDAIQNTGNSWIRVSLSSDDKHFYLAITDSGKGIPEDVVDRMMNPFYTTKEVGKGTGLGLSISKGLVESHGGELIYDKQSPNTRFIIKMPLSFEH